MHETAARLYKAAKTMKGVEGQSLVARLIHKTPQIMRNWEDRGISFEGMLDAQQYIGCSAVWIRHGIGPMVIGEPFTAPEDKSIGGSDDALKLTVETPRELTLLSVYRLSRKRGKMLIDDAVESAREDIDWSGVSNKSE
jgi:hypothetical protein